MIHLLKLRCKFTKTTVFILLLPFSSCSTSPAPQHFSPFGKRASRKCHRKTLLYISGLGMMIFIFIAAILVRNMDGFSSTRSFLNTQESPKAPDGGATDDGSFDEVYLLISILCYNSFSAVGVMILPWTLISELYSIEARH